MAVVEVKTLSIAWTCHSNGSKSRRSHCQESFVGCTIKSVLLHRLSSSTKSILTAPWTVPPKRPPKEFYQRRNPHKPFHSFHPAASLTFAASGGSSTNFGTSSCRNPGISPTPVELATPPSISASSPKASNSASNSASSTSSGTS